MAGRFEGLSEIAWKLFEDLMPQSPEKRGRGWNIAKKYGAGLFGISVGSKGNLSCC